MTAHAPPYNCTTFYKSSGAPYHAATSDGGWVQCRSVYLPTAKTAKNFAKASSKVVAGFHVGNPLAQTKTAKNLAKATSHIDLNQQKIVRHHM